MGRAVENGIWPATSAPSQATNFVTLVSSGPTLMVFTQLARQGKAISWILRAGAVALGCRRLKELLPTVLLIRPTAA